MERGIPIYGFLPNVATRLVFPFLDFFGIYWQTDSEGERPLKETSWYL
jgi:hypothetical protein